LVARRCEKGGELRWDAIGIDEKLKPVGNHQRQVS
jgi:hypothetical protein